ncbi:MAG: hypothetical protein GX640_23730 [Fibrobacter sp.]|nr:hypothetical protein [Fibrobacter sp.]
MLRGLFPAGFSAEHLGPNDYYYWDDFWGVAGLRAAAWMLGELGEMRLSDLFYNEARDFMKCIDESITAVAELTASEIMPASPNRRADSGAVGSLAVGYPLSLWESNNSRLLATASYLFNNCIINNAFYHDISHSGINPYLTIHIAEVFLRAGDKRFWSLVNGIANLATQTGQWPEAIHPQLKTGCMGDGQHVWAAAEWIVILRNSFVREEFDTRTLVLCSGIHNDMLKSGSKISCGPVSTPFGRIELEINSRNNIVRVNWKGTWHNGLEPVIKIAFPEKEVVDVVPGITEHTFSINENTV